MTEREQFEEWIAENRPDVELYRRDVKGSTRFGEYCKSNVQESWEVWQASRRAALDHCTDVLANVASHGGDMNAAIGLIRALSQQDPQ